MLLIAFLLAIITIPSTVLPTGFSFQPPFDPYTYYIGSTGQPSRLDPARAYDAASGELLQNVYQTLIWFSDKHPITFTPTVGYNLTAADYADLTRFGPVLCTEVPTQANGRIIINNTGSYWKFTINTNAIFQPWVNRSGGTEPSRNITADDIVYSFRRQVVYDSPYGPTQMWMTPAFGFGSWSKTYNGKFDTYDNGTFKNVEDENAAATLIQNWCYNIGNDVYFNFTVVWPENVMKQIFAQTWGSVVNPDFVKAYGGWDGLFTTGDDNKNMMAGWTNNYHWKPTATRSELDTWKNSTLFPNHGSTYSYFYYQLSGTGPYRFTSWDQWNMKWRIDAWQNYWKGWNGAGEKNGDWTTGNFFKTVIETGVSAYPTREMQFLKGESDTANIPIANMYDLLVNKYNPIAGINLVYNIAALQNDAMLFDFNIPSASPYQAYIGYPNHIGAAKPYFFNNIYIRQAFAWALNYTSYLHDAWFDEAILQRSWWVDGLLPPEYKNTNASMPQRNLSGMLRNALDQAIIDGYNIGDVGFDVTLVYNVGNDQRQIACSLIAQAFSSWNTAYHVNVVGVDWQTYSNLQSYGYLPAYIGGWGADFADPDNFCEAYQASQGAFLASQGPPFPGDQAIVDLEIWSAMVEQNSIVRGQMYQDLQYRYWLDVPSFPLDQRVGRRFARDWVQGWYYNALLPGEYAYDLWKSIITPNPDVDVDATATITPVDTIYTTALIFHGAMYLGFTGGKPHTSVDWQTGAPLSPENMTYRVHVAYRSGTAANLIITLGLKRNSTQTYGETRYPNVTHIILSPGEEYSTEFFWQEDGVESVVRADNAQEVSPPSGHYGTVYDIGFEAYPVNGNDIATGNNYIKATTWNASRLVGDCKSDGIVDIYDAIKLSGVFDATPADRHWNFDCDLKVDENNIIDIFDALALMGNFNRHVP